MKTRTTKGAVHRLEDMDTQFVSLVRAGANRQTKFMVVKRQEKQVPPADASNEDKRAAQEERARKYGIEALDAAAALSYPADAPTTEDLYGDPVNLKYPLGRTANEPDPPRIRNALARFVQNFEVYEQRASHAKIWERIVRAALKAGIDVSFDPNDYLDGLLPSDLKEELTKGTEQHKEQPSGASPADASDTSKDTDATDADFLAMLDAAGEKVTGKLVDAQIDDALRQLESAPAEAPADEETQKSAESGTRSDAPSDEDSASLRKQVAELTEKMAEMERAYRKAQDEAKRNQAAVRRLRASIGKASAISYGEVEESDSAHRSGRAPLWGGDLAAEASREE